MPILPPSQTFNIADPDNQARLMRLALDVLEPNRDLGFVLAHLVAAFIDGLVRAPKKQTRERYLAYLEEHFPDLCRSVSAKAFYDHVRNAAIHEFGIRPPFALAYEDKFSDRLAYLEATTIDGDQWHLFNVSKLVSDFRQHLDKISPSSK